MARKDGFELDDAIFKKRMRDLARQHGIDEGVFVKEQGGFLARDLARYAPPYAKFPSGRGTSIGTTKDKEQGEYALWTDLMKIFRIKDQSFLDYCRKNFGITRVDRTAYGRKGKEYRVAYTLICLSISDVRLWHKRNMRKDGRTRDMADSASTAWVSEDLLKKYYEMEVRKVGKAKASLAKAAIQLHSKIRAPKWVKRHIGSADAQGKVADVFGQPTAFIDANAAGLHHIGGKTINIVKRGRIRAMKTRLKHLFKANAKKAGFRVRG